MEKKKLTHRCLTFLTGTIFGGLLFGVFLLISGSRPPDSSSPAGSLPLANARIYYQKYMATKPPLIDISKGIPIDLDQLNAMNSILNQNSKVSGFRIYFGLDNAASKIGIVVGIDNLSNDITTNIIQSSRTYDPCPPICDTPSPIIN